MEILDAQKQRISRFGILSDLKSETIGHDSNLEADTTGMYCYRDSTLLGCILRGIPTYLQNLDGMHCYIVIFRQPYFKETKNNGTETDQI